VIFLQFSAAAHTSTVNCNEIDGDRPGKTANTIAIGCRASHELCSNYLLTNKPLGKQEKPIDHWSTGTCVWIITLNKKFELMLTGRAKAYSSFCPQAVTHRSTNRARHRVTSFQPKRVTNYATPPPPVPWRHLVNDIDLCRSA